MNKQNFIEAFNQNLDFHLTEGQQTFVNKVFDFVDYKGFTIFLLKGYAGTGKTTMIAHLIKQLNEINVKTVILAPTGRAAKVVGNYSKKHAFTIHKWIYQKNDSFGRTYFELKANKAKNTIFIIDESSMIGDGGNLQNEEFSYTSLLDDLVTYVESGMNCKLMFVGDIAQLPPVGQLLSKALDTSVLKEYTEDVFDTNFTEVVRQQNESGILYNATKLRLNLMQNDVKVQFDLFDDVLRISGSEFPDELDSAYSKYGEESVMVVCRSNKSANIYNHNIRNRIFYYEEELCQNDLMMVVKNNYFWLPKKSEAGFIANGDIIRISRVFKVEEKYGFRFADVEIELVDYTDHPPIELKIMLDVINMNTSNLPRENQKQLFFHIEEEYSYEHNKRMRYKMILENKYFNALQVKFSYAITTHKSQGGQWDCVFVDQGYLTSEMLNQEYLRWLYTAFTRAKEKVYLVNFADSFFS